MRLFVAVDIPEAVLESLAQLRARLERLCRGARWVRLENTHLTLKFIGEIAAEKLEAIRGALQRLPAGPAFDLNFHGLGFFPGEKRAKVFWAGVDGGAPLGTLAGAIERTLEPLGIPRETREFHPHLTLARLDSPKGLDSLRAAAAELATAEFGRATVREFHLYQSVLKRSGAEYTRLATYPLSPERAS